jgi:hypothetical protein
VSGNTDDIDVRVCRLVTTSKIAFEFAAVSQPRFTKAGFSRIMRLVQETGMRLVRNPSDACSANRISNSCWLADYFTRPRSECDGSARKAKKPRVVTLWHVMTVVGGGF